MIEFTEKLKVLLIEFADLFDEGCNGTICGNCPLNESCLDCNDVCDVLLSIGNTLKVDLD